MPICLAILSPCTRASYSATLFDARKCICSTYCSLSPLGEVRMTLGWVGGITFQIRSGQLGKFQIR
jgi:hypothetical protein